MKKKSVINSKLAERVRELNKRFDYASKRFSKQNKYMSNLLAVKKNYLKSRAPNSLKYLRKDIKRLERQCNLLFALLSGKECLSGHRVINMNTHTIKCKIDRSYKIVRMGQNDFKKLKGLLKLDIRKLRYLKDKKK